MSDPTYDMQIAQAAALLASDAVTALVGEGVYDALSAANATMPFIELGDDQAVPDTNACFDPADVFSTVHVWASGVDARLVCKRIVAAALPVLAQCLTLTGYKITSAVVRQVRHLKAEDETNDDALIGHSVMVIRYQTQPLKS